MVRSLNTLLCGDKPPMCQFCANKLNKNIAYHFWTYWSQVAATFVGTPREFRSMFYRELSGCAYCWQDAYEIQHKKDITICEKKLVYKENV